MLETGGVLAFSGAPDEMLSYINELIDKREFII
jgi:hypothetical protein